MTAPKKRRSRTLARAEPAPVCEVGAALRAARERRGVSQEDVAAVLGVSSATVRRWETHGRALTVDQLMRYSAALGARVTLAIVKGPAPRRG